MLLDAVVLTLLTSLIAGGRVARLQALDLRAVWVFLLAAGVRIALDVLGAKGVTAARGLYPWLSIGAYLLLLAGFWVNRHLWPLRLVALGVLLNFLVIAANGGSMPVEAALAERSAPKQLVRMLHSSSYVVHKPVTESTRLAFLADVLPLPMLYPRPKWYSPGSIGDIFITVGACALLLTSLGAFGLGRPKATDVEREAP